ncbi:hypothetical protein H5410_030584 [Solanum commersonii]|uniref:DUF7746 domain-containing protein n=1 Tax=Solanum commersonii TaxID=4109 RepID=A0A9J5YJS6_SOLCO|nr:hypothetical protein H5410_030584 [Solanum commersonii]
MIIAGFTGQLRGWWDNYISIEQKFAMINATSDSEGVDNLGMALVKNTKNGVYTLVLTILEHFNGRFTNQYETVRTLLNGLCCRKLGEFRWYKDTYMSRVIELPENSYEHWKAKFIDGLPPLFAERVRKTLRNEHGEIPYRDYTYGKLIRVCTQEGINLCNELKLSRQLTMNKLRERSQLGDFCVPFTILRLITKSNIEILDTQSDKPYRKKRSIYRSKEESDCKKNFKMKSNRPRIHLARLPISTPNCKLEKLKTLELDEEIHDKVYSFLYTSGSESDYDFDLGFEEEIDFLGLSDSNLHDKINTCNACHGDICSCENDEFYKLQSQFEDLNINTIIYDNVIELLKEVTDNNLREKIIQLAINNNASSSFSKNSEKHRNYFEFEYSAPYSLSKINNRLNKQTTHSRDSSFDDLKIKLKI